MNAYSLSFLWKVYTVSEPCHFHIISQLLFFHFIHLYLKFFFQGFFIYLYIYSYMNYKSLFASSYRIFEYNICRHLQQKDNLQMTIGKLKLKQTFRANGSSSSFRPKKSKEEKQEIQKIFDQKLKTKDKVFTYQPIQGSGMIVTSGTSLLGKQTKFNTEVTKGDYIQIQNPLLKTIEQRPVMAVLGHNSILLSEPFLQQFSTYTRYIVKRSPKVVEGQDISLEYKKKMQQLKLQKTKQINKQTLDLRIKKGMWGYEKQTVDISKGASKQQLLDIRAKKIKDKHCW